MGSYNETCMLSHLQIICGDDVKLIILVKNNNSNHFCYHNEMYAPLCLPIDAKYNDYGGVEDVVVPEYTERLLGQLVFTNEDCTETYKYDSKNESIERFVDKIIDGSGLYLYDCPYPLGKPSFAKKLECVYVHKDLYDILVEDFKKRKPCNNKNTLYELYNKKYSCIENDLQTFENAEDKSSLLYQMRFERKMETVLYRTAAIGYQFPKKYIDVGAVNSNNFSKFEKELLDYIMFDKSLQFGRYGYLTKCGMGGQDLDVRIQSLVANFVLDFSQREYEKDSKVYTTNESIYWYDNKTYDCEPDEECEHEDLSQ